MNYWIYTAEKCHKTRSRIKIFMEKSTFFRQIDVFAKEVTTELISRIFQAWLRFMLLFHTVCVCGRTRNSLSRKIFSSNQLFSNFFSETIAFTRLFRKKCVRDFLQFPHCVSYYVTVYCGNYRNSLSHTFYEKISWKQLFY